MKKKSKTYNKYTFIKFLYDLLLTTLLIFIFSYIVFNYDIFGTNIDFNSTLYRLFNFNIYLLVIVFRIISGYDNVIPRFLTLRDKFLGFNDGLKLNKDYKKNKKMYDGENINTAHIKELNISKYNWINKLLIEYNENTAYYKDEIEKKNNEINLNKHTISKDEEKLELINKKMLKKNKATEVYYLTNEKEKLNRQIKNLNLLTDELIKEKNILILEHKNKYSILEKEKNIISSEYEIRYKNYINIVFKKINRNGYKYNIEELENYEINFISLEEV